LLAEYEPDLFRSIGAGVCNGLAANDDAALYLTVENKFIHNKDACHHAGTGIANIKAQGLVGTNGVFNGMGEGGFKSIGKPALKFGDGAVD